MKLLQNYIVGINLPKIFSDRFILYCLLLIYVVVDLIATSLFGFTALLIFAIIPMMLLVFHYQRHIDVSVFLITLNLLPLFYLDPDFHHSMKWILVQDSVLFVFILAGVDKYIREEQSSTITISYLRQPIYFFFFYFSISALIGLFRSHSNKYVFDEYYHTLYYVFALIVVFVIQYKDQYHTIFKTIVAITFVISLEYIFFYVTNGFKRVVTFQSELFPFCLALITSLTIWQKIHHGKLLKWVMIGVPILLALYISLTRVLWVSGFVGILIVFIIYMRTHKILSFKIFGASFLILSIAFVLISSSSSTNKKIDMSDPSYKIHSITNPGSDLSFLMRVEIGYYALEKFIASPIVGAGLGDFVNFRILSTERTEIIYPDNSWLFFLWKGGIIGFGIFIWLIYRFFKRSIYHLRVSIHSDEFPYITGIVGGLSALLVSGVLSGTLIKYKYVLIISYVMAYIMFLDKNEK